jgi:hypothetical protein
MAARQFDTDAPYIVHPHSAALAYEPLPNEVLRSLHIVRDLMTYTVDPVELAWLEAREAFLTAHCADCPPARVRNVEPARRDRPPRRESKYAMFNRGPANKSGKARS